MGGEAAKASEDRRGGRYKAFISHGINVAFSNGIDITAGIYEFLTERRLAMRQKKGEKINNRGMGTVEIILIIVVLIGLVLIFKTQIQQLVETVFQKIAVDSAAILS